MLVAITDRWIESVPLLKILCVGGAFLSFYTLYQHLVIASGRSDIYMWCNVGQIVIQILLILLFHSRGIQTMVVVYTLFTILWLAVWQYHAKRLIGITVGEVLRDTVPFMLAAVGVMAVTYFATSFITVPQVLLPVRIFLAAALYALVMKVAKVQMFEECIRFLRKKKQ